MQSKVDGYKSSPIIVSVYVKGFRRPRQGVFGATVRQLATIRRPHAYKPMRTRVNPFACTTVTPDEVENAIFIKVVLKINILRCKSCKIVIVTLLETKIQENNTYIIRKVKRCFRFNLLDKMEGRPVHVVPLPRDRFSEEPLKLSHRGQSFDLQISSRVIICNGVFCIFICSPLNAKPNIRD